MKQWIASGVGLVIALSQGWGQVLFWDDFETDLSAWTADAPWARTAQAAFRGYYGAHDSPGTYYENNANRSLTRATAISLSGTTAPALAFWHRYSLEEGYDWGYVEASSNGTVWIPLASYTGNQGEWTYEQVDLTPFADMPSFWFRFRLVTDDSVVRDGWFLDDVVLGERPEAPVLDGQAQTNPPGVVLAWSATPGILSATVLRSTTSNFNWRTATRVAILDGSATNYFDITASPKTRYFYRIMVTTAAGLSGWSNEKEIVTPALMDFPFLDDGEGGSARWNAEYPWALTTETSASPTHAWADSPGGEYGNNRNTALTLARALDLRGSTRPGLSFRHQYRILNGDFGLVEVSGNNGTDWTILRSYTDGAVTGRWVWQRFDLSAYTNSNQVLVRFRLTSNSSGTADGWYVDDITISELPDPIPTPVAEEVRSSALRLSWPASSHPQFQCYRIYRSESPGVSLDSTLVGEVFDQGTPVFEDTLLKMDTTYYYRIYQVTRYGAISPDGGERQVRTLSNPVPLAESFEGPLVNWILTGRWGTSTNGVFQGIRCLSDSPDSSYQPAQDSYAQISVDLRGATWPVMRFWDRFELGAGDWARLEVSSDGNNWTYVHGYYEGVRTNWEEQVVDLSPWKGQANVRLRFRVVTDGNAGTVGDGWNVDELRVEELAAEVLPYPYYEDFEAGFGSNWLHAGWAVRSNDVYEGMWAARVPAESRPGPDVQYWMMPAGWVDLRGAVNPQMVFWVKAYLTYWSFFRVHVSENGVNWTELGAANVDYNANTGWVRKQVDLGAWTGKLVRIRFFLQAGSALQADVKVDRIGIGGDVPSAPQPRSPINGESVPTPLPVLTVRNAVDFQGDPLTYQFEVYADEALTQKVAEVPAVAENSAGTSWQVDQELSNNRQYWWRCRVSDGPTTSAWSSVATFFVNRANLPPTAPVLLAPSDRGQEFRHAGVPLVWLSSVETQAHDRVILYEVEIARDAAFMDRVVQTNLVARGGDIETRSLGEVIADVQTLEVETWYYWRVRGQDAWEGWSEWSTPRSFILVESPPGGGGEPPSYPLIRLSDSRVELECLEGERPASRAYSLQNSGQGLMEYVLSSDVEWITVTPTNGSSIGEWDPMVLSFATEALPGGWHTGRVVVTSAAASNSPQSLVVVLRVIPLSVTDRPNLTAPEDETSFDPTNAITFLWSGVERATAYELEVTDTMDGWTTNVLVPGAQGTSAVIAAAWEPGFYEWSVRGRNDRGSGPRSATNRFAIGVTNTLSIQTPHGAPTPPVGVHAYRWRSVVTAEVQAVVVEGFATYTCTGWVGSGSVPATGASNRVVFVLTNDSTICWLWHTNVAEPSVIDIQPLALNPSTMEGVNAANGLFWVRNAGAGVLNWQVTSDAWWMQPVPASGASTGEWDQVSVVYLADWLLYGSYTGRLVVSDPAVPIPAVTVTVTLVVRPNQVPATPVPLAPEEGAIVPVTDVVTYVWSSVPRALQYRVWVGKDGDPFAHDITSGPETNWPIAGPYLPGLYTWFVLGENQIGQGGWSTTVTYRVVRWMDPEGDLPANAEVERFQWTPTPDATAFRVVVERYNLANGQWVAMGTGETAVAEWVPNGLTFPNGSYRWSLQEFRGGEWTPPEPFRYFQVGVPGISISEEPSGTLYEYKNVLFRWTSVSRAAEYQVQVLRGTAIYTNTAWTADTQMLIRLSNEAAAYTWRVRARNAAGIGAWTPPRAFSYALLKAPKLVAPLKGVIVPTKPEFVWREVAGARTYRVTVRNLTTGQAWAWTIPAGPNPSLVSPVKLPKGEYAWQVQAINPSQKSPLSAEGRFKR